MGETGIQLLQLAMIGSGSVLLLIGLGPKLIGVGRRARRAGQARAKRVPRTRRAPRVGREPSVPSRPEVLEAIEDLNATLVLSSPPVLLASPEPAREQAEGSGVAPVPSAFAGFLGRIHQAQRERIEGDRSASEQLEQVQREERERVERLQDWLHAHSADEADSEEAGFETRPAQVVAAAPVGEEPTLQLRRRRVEQEVARLEAPQPTAPQPKAPAPSSLQPTLRLRPGHAGTSPTGLAPRQAAPDRSGTARTDGKRALTELFQAAARVRRNLATNDAEGRRRTASRLRAIGRALDHLTGLYQLLHHAACFNAGDVPESLWDERVAELPLVIRTEGVQP